MSGLLCTVCGFDGESPGYHCRGCARRYVHTDAATADLLDGIRLATAALEQIRSRSRHSIWRGLTQCFDIADAALERLPAPSSVVSRPDEEE